MLVGLGVLYSTSYRFSGDQNAYVKYKYFLVEINTRQCWDFPSGLVVTPPCNAGYTGSIPSLGTKIHTITWNQSLGYWVHGLGFFFLILLEYS